jgi:DNA-binding NtrC family response regulator
MDRTWPGNVAELAWVASEALRACPGGLLKELPGYCSPEAQPMLLPRPPKGKLADMVKDIAASSEKRFLEEALIEANGDLAKASKRLGMTVKNYIHKLRTYGISLKDA